MTLVDLGRRGGWCRIEFRKWPVKWQKGADKLYRLLNELAFLDKMRTSTFRLDTFSISWKLRFLRFFTSSTSFFKDFHIFSAHYQGCDQRWVPEGSALTFTGKSRVKNSKIRLFQTETHPCVICPCQRQTPLKEHTCMTSARWGRGCHKIHPKIYP